MKQNESKSILALEWLVLLAMVALASFLRYWRIEEVPPGFNSDEAVGAMGALKTLREGFQYSYEGLDGGGALGFYFATVAFYLFGPSIATIRGLARARWLAGLSTLALATSLWHISASRIAFAGIPFLIILHLSGPSGESDIPVIGWHYAD